MDNSRKIAKFSFATEQTFYVLLYYPKKTLKYRTPEKFAVITLKFDHGGSTIE